MRGLFQQTNVDALNYGMSTLSRKSDIISQNIANGDTPMFKAGKLEFDEVMAEYFSGGSRMDLAVTQPNHIQPPSFTDDPSSFARFQNNPSTRNDGNDVNMDYEMSELSQTSVQFDLLSQLSQSGFSKLKTAIQGR